MTKARSNAVANAVKGDLTVGSGTNLSGVLSVGNNGETLVADSSTTTGLRYQGSMAAGRNAVINGGMDIWQRGTSTTTQGYSCVDRFFLYSSAATTTFSQETSIIPVGARYSLKISQATNTALIAVIQAIETSNAIIYAGKTVTFSMSISGSSAISANIKLAYSTSVDNPANGTWTAITATSGGTGTTGTGGAFNSVNGVFAIPSTAKSIQATLEIPSLTAGSSVYYSLAQLELGSVATTFTRAAGTIQGELAACQRYYYQAATGNLIALGGGFNNGATTMEAVIQFPVTMRTVPTLSQTTGTDYYIFNRAGANDGFNSFTIDRASQSVAVLYNGTEISGTSGNAGWVYTNNASASLGFTSEL